MSSVPLHSEVVQFAKQLVEAIRSDSSVEDDYDVSCISNKKYASVLMFEQSFLLSCCLLIKRMLFPSLISAQQVASEHEHSCCVLIATRRYFIRQQWHTHIDYDKFILAWRR
eukprot:189086-Hanusia_phi.AAC.1